jgi:hypothetical protein
MFSQRASSVDRKLSRLAFATPPKRAQKPYPRYPCRWLCHCRSHSSSIAQPHAISPRSAFLRQSRHGAGVVIGSWATRTFIPCARRTKWRGRGPIGGSDRCGAVALAGGSGRPSSIIPHPSLPSLPFPSPALPFRFHSGIERPSERRPASHIHSVRMFARTMGARSDRFPLQQVKLVGEAVTFKVGRGRSTNLNFVWLSPAVWDCRDVREPRLHERSPKPVPTSADPSRGTPAVS